MGRALHVERYSSDVEQHPGPPLVGAHLKGVVGGGLDVVEQFVAVPVVGLSSDPRHGTPSVLFGGHVHLNGGGQHAVGLDEHQHVGEQVDHRDLQGALPDIGVEGPWKGGGAPTSIRFLSNKP